MAKKIAFMAEEDLEKIIVKDALSNNVSVAEIIRRRLVDSYSSTQKQEEKVVKRFDEFEKNVYNRIDELENKMMSAVTKDIMYSITNFHYLKMLTLHGLNKTVGDVKNLVSLAKSETLFNPTDSINSKKRFEENINEEHLKS
jgi:hypothetical protein